MDAGSIPAISTNNFFRRKRESRKKHPMQSITVAINKITDHMIENNIRATRIKGFRSIEDLGAMGTEFHHLVYDVLKSLPTGDQKEALRILGSLNI